MCTKNHNSWDKVWDKTGVFVISGHFLAFYTPPHLHLPSPTLPQWCWKLNFFKNEKNATEYYPFKHVYHKWKSCDVWFLKYKVWQIEFDVILDNFLPFNTSGDPKNKHFGKLKTNTLRYYNFIHVCNKCQLNDICFLSYRGWRTDFFISLGHFLPFYPTNNLQN